MLHQQEMTLGVVDNVRIRRRRLSSQVGAVFNLRLDPHIAAWRVLERFQLAAAGLAGGDFRWRLGDDPLRHRHQEPGVSLAAATQDSKSPFGGSPLHIGTWACPAG